MVHSECNLNHWKNQKDELIALKTYKLLGVHIFELSWKIQKNMNSLPPPPKPNRRHLPPATTCFVPVLRLQRPWLCS